MTPVLGEPYRLVVKYTHNGQVYDRADVWVDPGHNGGVEPPPDVTNAEQSSLNGTVTHVGIRTSRLDGDDRFLFGSLKIGSSWSDVVPPP